MAKRIFTSFAIEDARIRDLFVGQARHDKVPYELVDMSVKEPWSSEWKTKCRTKIKGCDGVVVLISKNLKNADGAIWEINCAKEEGIPILGVYMTGCNIFDSPNELNGIKKVTWTWANIADFVNGL
ncbi:TIR domain-containing protein [Belliella pelovolcani]|uniref:TIR domain-containing protein n=1 Tax=Belliella pelovolcani TaxID=529505 RepID=A0A1N7PS68_9BACT|nr:TIR domain-containing protein [Belliella pelovolcani]SIT13464.1 TIR domain-containing protein [Belliella pelovolcani]